VERLKCAFMMMDCDGSEIVTRTEMVSFLHTIANRPVNRVEVESMADLLMAEVDTNCSGQVTFQEFMAWPGKDVVLQSIQEYHTRILNEYQAAATEVTPATPPPVVERSPPSARRRQPLDPAGTSKAAPTTSSAGRHVLPGDLNGEGVMSKDEMDLFFKKQYDNASRELSPRNTERRTPTKAYTNSQRKKNLESLEDFEAAVAQKSFFYIQGHSESFLKDTSGELKWTAEKGSAVLWSFSKSAGGKYNITSVGGRQVEDPPGGTVKAVRMKDAEGQFGNWVVSVGDGELAGRFAFQSHSGLFLEECEAKTGMHATAGKNQHFVLLRV